MASDLELMVLCGIDPSGQSHDYTTFAAVQPRYRIRGGGKLPEVVFVVRRARRLDLALRQVRVAERIGSAIGQLSDYLSAERRKLPLNTPGPRILARIDATGLGRPIAEVVEDAIPPRAKRSTTLLPCYFNKLDKIERTPRGLSVGKAYLVSRLQALVQTQRIEFPEDMEQKEAMLQELMDYEIRVDVDGADTYGAFSTGTYDDLVTAVGLAVLEDPPPPKVTGAFRVY